MDSDDKRGEVPNHYEMYLLITKFLEGGPCKQTADLLKKEIEQNGLVPPRLDWEGDKHKQSLDTYMASNCHVAPDHLSKICNRFCTVLDKVVPSSVSGVRTLLGAGRLSLLRTEEDAKFTQWPGKMNAVLRNQQPLLHPHNLKNAPNLCHALLGRELCGTDRHDRLLPITMYDSHMSMHLRVLGHLSAVFCVLFDKTGHHIFTGADDGLIKLWTTKDCRLLFTFRGHSGEVSDMAINHENTILASGSCDKTLRIWCLKTGAQISVLHGHGSAVTSIQFCPMVRGDVRYLVSTGGDGCVCFWKYTYGPTYEFESKPVKFIERSRAGAQMICQSFSPGGVFLATGSTDQSIRVYSFLSLHPEKISEVDPHTDRVDSIQFSNHGDRFMSGSKDGTARIWRYQRQEWHFMTLSMTTRLSDTPEPDEPKPKLKVNMVRWSHDDDYVITAVSDCSIKLWNSWTGALLCVMRGHDDEVFVIEVNPVDRRIILTAGHDGKINLWSIPEGRLIRTLTNNIPGQGHGAVFDCKFAPDGHTFAATDSHGHLIIFGMGSSDPYMRVPNEQFFHTDYRPLIRDGQGFVLDEQTQQPPHIMPPPFLVDMDGCPHPIQFQRLVPGRENCKDNQLIPQIGTAENGDREVVGDNMDDDLLGGGDHELDQANAYNLRQENGVRNNGENAPAPFASPDRQPGVRRASGNVPVSRLATNQDILASSKRRIARGLDRASIIRCRAQRQAHADAELTRFMRERKQKPLPVSRSDSSDGGYNIKTRRKKKGRGRTAYVSQMEDTAVNRLVTRALYDTEPEDESSTTDPQPEENGLHEPVYESDDADAVESSDYSDWMADAQVNLQPPLRTSKRTRKRPRVSLLSSDQESDDNVSVASSTHSSTRPARKRKPPKRNQPDAQQPSTSQKHDKPKKKGINEYKDIKELPSQFLPPEWLTGVLPRKAPYAPQMGDEVVYLRQGHQLYVDAVNRAKLCKIDMKTLPYVRNPSMRDVEYVKVIGIKYEVRPPRLACLKLGYINPMTGNLMKESFTIKYHDMADVLDFLVLRQTYDLANGRNWKVGDRFCSIIDDAWWMGTVDKQGPSDKKFPESPFQCFHVKWDNGESELMSPWDLEPLEDHRIPSEKGGSKPLSSDDHASLAYHAKESDWPTCGRGTECDRLVEGLENIMQLSIAEPFLAPVDLNRYPIYAIVIEYLIDLTTIKCRLENRYYRRISALQFDVRYIEMNARVFNETGSEIIKRAKSITKLFLEFIRQSDCDDPMRLFQGMKKAREVDSGSETEIEGENGAPQKRSAQELDDSPPRKRVRNDYVVTSESWKQQSRQLLNAIVELDDSTPFREPVNTDLYPQYLDVIPEPMDLGTVLNKLDEEHYPDPTHLQCDLRLIFKNSKAFNSKKSKIYTMTLRLSAHVEEKFRNILSDWKSAVRCERHTRSSARIKPRTSRGTAVVAPLMASTSGTSDPGPSTSGGRSRVSRTRSGGVMASESVERLDSSSDDATTDRSFGSGSETELEMVHESVERVWGKRGKRSRIGAVSTSHSARKSSGKRPKRRKKETYAEDDSDATDVDSDAERGSRLSSDNDVVNERHMDDRERSDVASDLSDDDDNDDDRNNKSNDADSSGSDEEESPRTRAKRYAAIKRRRPNGAVTNGAVKRKESHGKQQKQQQQQHYHQSSSSSRTSRRSRGNPRYCEETDDDEPGTTVSSHGRVREESDDDEPETTVSSRGRVRKITEKARRANMRH